mgnify:CR=1 FL=1
MILGISSPENTYLTATFNHYGFSGLTHKDLLLPENSPFLWHPNLSGGVLAIAKDPRLKWVISTLKFDLPQLTLTAIYNDFLVPLKNRLEELGLQIEGDYLQDYIFMMKDGIMAQIDPHGVIDIDRALFSSKETRGLSLVRHDLIKDIDPITQLKKIVVIHETYTHKKLFPMSLVEMSDLRRIIIIE